MEGSKEVILLVKFRSNATNKITHVVFTKITLEAGKASFASHTVIRQKRILWKVFFETIGRRHVEKKMIAVNKYWLQSMDKAQYLTSQPETTQLPLANEEQWKLWNVSSKNLSKITFTLVGKEYLKNMAVCVYKVKKNIAAEEANKIKCSTQLRSVIKNVFQITADKSVKRNIAAFKYKCAMFERKCTAYSRKAHVTTAGKQEKLYTARAKTCDARL